MIAAGQNHSIDVAVVDLTAYIPERTNPSSITVCVSQISVPAGAFQCPVWDETRSLEQRKSV